MIVQNTVQNIKVGSTNSSHLQLNNETTDNSNAKDSSTNSTDNNTVKNNSDNSGSQNTNTKSNKASSNSPQENTDSSNSKGDSSNTVTHKDITQSTSSNTSTDKVVQYSNQQPTKMLQAAKSGQVIEKDGMKFQGLQTMKIAPDQTGSMFLSTPGFDENGYASNVNKALYNYELNLNNDQSAMNEAIQLHGGNPIDTCVFFQSSALRAIGQQVPDSIGYTTHLENWLSNNGWTRHTDFAYIQKGDICFASYYHTFLFMGWKDKAKGIAYVMGNESFTDPYYRARNLNGQSPQVYGDDSYYRATCYWTYGQGYTGPHNTPDPVDNSGGTYGAIGTTRVTSPIGLNINPSIGSSTVLTTIPNNVVVPVISQENGWFKVFYNGQTGWIDGQYTNGLAESMGGGNSNPTAQQVGGPYISGPAWNPANNPNTSSNNNNSGSNTYIGTGTITANGGLWLNGNPSLSNPNNLQIIPQNATVNIIATQGAWDKVEYDGQVGWAYAQYINANIKKDVPPVQHTSTSTGSVALTPLNGYTTVTAASLYLNNKPEPTWSGATVVDTLSQGTKVKVLGKTANGWFKVSYNGEVGYISASYTTGYQVDKPALNGWQTSGGNTYLYKNGVKQTGWQVVNGKRYYFDSSGVMQTGWKQLNNIWYYLGSNGVASTGLNNIGGATYYMNSNGAMQKGWQTVNGNKYYFNTSNGKACTTSMVLNNTEYIFNSQGILQSQHSTLAPKPITNGSTSNGMQPASGTATVTASSLYLNNKPEPTWDGAVVENTLSQGDVVNILAKNSNGWAKVSYNGEVGYIDLAYTSVGNISVGSVNSNTTSTINSPVGLWLLSSPGFSGNQMVVMPYNATVTVTGVQGNWSHVIYNGQSGWAYTQYLTPSVAKSYIDVTSPVGLWLLGSPSFSGNQIEVMPSGAKLEVLGTSGPWTQVSYEGQTGWCYTQYTAPAN